VVDKNLDIQLSAETLEISKNYNFVLDEKCGGIDMFVGTVRRWNKDEEITHLDFECYEPMALSELKKIANKAFSQFGLHKISVHHRTGHVGLKDIAVVIAVSAKHRKAAFEGCEFIIDELKKTVPIWKKEFLIDGSHWVNSRP
jgi:molybdopterin synthase catalytic subunit